MHGRHEVALLFRWRRGATWKALLLRIEFVLGPKYQAVNWKLVG